MSSSSLWGRVSLWSPDWPGIQYVDQICLLCPSKAGIKGMCHHARRCQLSLRNSCGHSKCCIMQCLLPFSIVKVWNLEIMRRSRPPRQKQLCTPEHSWSKQALAAGSVHCWRGLAPGSSAAVLWGPPRTGQECRHSMLHLLFLKISSCYVAKAGLKLMILLP